MKKKGSLLTILLILNAAMFSETVLAYGADADKADCKKPKFRKFTPPQMTEVAPGSEISFHVTHVIDPQTIKVTAKKIPVEVEVIDKNAFYNVKGKLPESLQDTFARISIKAGTQTKCKEQGGWLLKIKASGQPDEQPADAAAVKSPEQSEATTEAPGTSGETTSEPVKK